MYKMFNGICDFIRDSDNPSRQSLLFKEYVQNNAWKKLRFQFLSFVI